MKIALAGTGRLGLELLKALLTSHHEVVALIQNGRRVTSTRRKLNVGLASVMVPSATVTGTARRNGIPVLWIDKMTEDELAPLRALEPDLLLVGGFGIILKAPILGLPRIGCINTHSALLPKHRGPNPFTAAILSNDTETGVTFHVMDEGIDTGGIVAQYSVPIRSTDTAGVIYRSTCELAGKHVLEVLDRVEREGLHGEPQDLSLATYDQKMKPEETFIDWTKSAEEIDRFVRACVPFMVPKFKRRGSLVYVTGGRHDSKPVDGAPGTVLQAQPVVRVATGEGSYTVLQAYSLLPLPWFWPAPWTRPSPGEILE